MARFGPLALGRHLTTTAAAAAIIAILPLASPATAQTSNNNTADTPTLKTWWHASGEINTQTPVGDTNVRQSHLYSVQVQSTSDNGSFYDSFVYEAIPRSGKGQICAPGDYGEICPEYDGVSVENDVGITMAWTQFLYGADVKLKVRRSSNGTRAVSADMVTVRPTTLEFDIEAVDDAVVITVPYTPDTNGVRFSLEFADDMFAYHKGATADEYLTNATSLNDKPVVGVEPRNSLLVFASPFPSPDMVPDAESEDTYVVQPGWVDGLYAVANKVVYFGPGVYFFTGTGHANLSSSVEWVHLAPGAYVKGAVQYNNPTAPVLRATGFGVLSGEMYVYQANPADGWRNTKSDASSLKMWRGEGITSGQRWVLHGITMASPPFNSMDFYGDTDRFAVDVADYKQVAGFYAQTDGLEMYPGSTVRDVFYHTGDDTVKAYHSDVAAGNIVVWKTDNAPVVQLGWYPRNVTNVTVSKIDVIHSRYADTLSYAPRALVGSSSSYEDVESTLTADTGSTLSNVTISGLRSEGISPPLLGLNLLANVDSLLVQDVWIEKMADPSTGLDVSTVQGFTNADGQKISIGENSPNGLGLVVENLTIGGEVVTMESTLADDFSVDGAFDGRWIIR